MAFRNVCKIVSVVLGPLLIILGVCAKWAIFPTVVDNLVHSYLTLEPSNKDTWDAWIEPTTQQPLFMKFTFFNVENADEIVADNVKPRVTEKGAFAYREVRRKEHVRTLLDEISYGSYTHYEFDADASDEGSKDPESKVTIINPVLAIVNAVLLQLHERVSFDSVFSWVDVDCKGLEAEGKTNGDLVCAAIPNGIYRIKCSTAGQIVAAGCDALASDPVMSSICASGLLDTIVEAACTEDTDGTGQPDTMVIQYKDGEIFFPKLDPELTQPFQITCNSLMAIVSTMVPELALPIDCADPLGLWVRVENFLLNPLKALTNCEPNEFPEDVSNCTGTDDSFYDNVPAECFCDGLTMTDTVNNLIFKGAHSGMLLGLHHVLENADLTALMPNFITILQQLFALQPEILAIIEQFLAHINLANWIDKTLDGMGMTLLDLKHGKFGFFRGPNGSNATRSWWKINSGKYQFDLYNQITEFNGMTRLPENWWYGFGPTPSAHASGVRGICHDIIGADGISYPPEAITKTDSIWIFNDQLSRSIWLDFVQEADVDGILTYQYSPKPDVFAMTNPDNFCYCPKVEQCAKVDETQEDAWDISECQNRTLKLETCLDGLLILQGSYGVPIIMSTPHFLDADEELPKAFDGVQPDREKHITFLNIEPTTGMSLQAHKRIQVSVPVAYSKYFQDLQKFVDKAVWPVVWVDEGADATQENIDMVKSMLVTPFIMVDVGTGLLIGIGGVLLILSAALHFLCKPSPTFSKS